MVEIKIENCPYCGSKELGFGYQSAQGAIMCKKSGFAGSKVEHVICTECGSIVHSRVAKPEIFKNIIVEKEKKSRRKKLENGIEKVKKPRGRRKLEKSIENDNESKPL